MTGLNVSKEMRYQAPGSFHHHLQRGIGCKGQIFSPRQHSYFSGNIELQQMELKDYENKKVDDEYHHQRISFANSG
jgi:hypothetical protein